MLFGGLLLLLILAGIWLWTPDKDRAGLEARDTNGPADFVEAANYLKAIANITLVPVPGGGTPAARRSHCRIAGVGARLP